MAWMPFPVRPCPVGVSACQAEPLAEVHTTTSWWPGVLPNVPVARYWLPVAVPVPVPVPVAVPVVVAVPVPVPVAVPVAVSAVTSARPDGTGRADSAQVRPPSAELAANGSCWPTVVSAVPTATTVRPLLATYWSTARVAPTGSGTFCWVQAWPFGEVQAAAAWPAAPTATKPCGPAVTACICRAPFWAPGVSPGVSTVPRCQPVRPV